MLEPEEQGTVQNIASVSCVVKTWSMPSSLKREEEVPRTKPRLSYFAMQDPDTVGLPDAREEPRYIVGVNDAIWLPKTRIRRCEFPYGSARGGRQSPRLRSTWPAVMIG